MRRVGYRGFDAVLTAGHVTDLPGYDRGSMERNERRRRMKADRTVNQERTLNANFIRRLVHHGKLDYAIREPLGG
jgi:hypothetical protein